MPRCRRGPFWFLSTSLLALLNWALLLAMLTLPHFQPEPVSAASRNETAGSLQILGKDGSIQGDCPLKHTEVRGAISGFLARVVVMQRFENPARSPIEAIYTFPLPQNALVDDMTIQVGERTIRSVIKKRDEARAIYGHAKARGHVAALLDQERPNIFTQSVANIMPGEQVSVTISYAETLQYENGAYEFMFPMVVGPRYIPGQATDKQAGGWSPDTNKVPDASRITPPVGVPETRAGHDISLEIAIDAGVPMQKLRSSSHDIDVERGGAGRANVKLRNQAEIPNKDFMLKYQVAGEQISDAVLTKWAPSAGKAASGGYFTLILQPPARVPESDITPKELVFVLDTSGSMFGFPLEKAKELISHALDDLYPGDTFNLITFSGDTRILFPEPVFPTAENIRIAKQLLQNRQGYGGTEMMKAIRAALTPSDSQDHIRIVCFLTDGFVGNDLEIIGEVQKHPNARVFAFGIGNSVNRFLIEGMAKAGRGDSEIVTLNDKADAAAHRLYERLRSPLLTDLSIDWRGLPVTDVYPQRLADLFDGKPLIVTGRYAVPAAGTIRLRGRRAVEDFVREIPIALATNSSQHDVLAGFWARRRIDDLMSQDWGGMQNGNVKPEVQKEITQLGLDYRLMTQFTSFVAVGDRVVTKDGKPQRVEVPVEMPEGVSYEGVFGDKFSEGYWMRSNQTMAFTMNAQVATKSRLRKGSGTGVSSGSAGGVMGGVIASPNGLPMQAAPPPPPPISAVGGGDRESSDSAAKLSPERKTLDSKLHPALLAAFDCAVKAQQECKLVNAGKVEVQIFLTQDSASVVGQLRKLGFEPAEAHSAAKMLKGRLPVEKLQALVQIAEVRFVSPVRK